MSSASFLTSAGAVTIFVPARILIEGVYLILYDYRPDDDVVEIVSVVDGRRDLKTLTLFSE